MKPLDLLYETTKQLKSVLDQSFTDQEREYIIDEVNQLIEKRGEIMKEIGPSFSESEQKIGEKIIALNVDIEKKMETLFEEVKQDMRQVNKQKKSNRSYINPYRNMGSTDGMYHDSKQ